MGAAKRSFTGWSACRLRGYAKVRTQPIYRFSTKVELIYPHERRGIANATTSSSGPCRLSGSVAAGVYAQVPATDPTAERADYRGWRVYKLFKFVVAGTQISAVRFSGIAIEPSTPNGSV